MRYQTAGKKRPSGNNATKSLTLSWYRHDYDASPLVVDHVDREVETEFQSLALELRPSVETSGLDDGFLLREYAAYSSMSPTERKEFALLHAAAVEQYRLRLCSDDSSTMRIDKLPPMSERKKDQLCGLLMDRVHTLESGAEPVLSASPVNQRRHVEDAITHANEDEPDLFGEGELNALGVDVAATQRVGTYAPRDDEFVDDAEVMSGNARRRYDRRRGDYASLLDQTFGGNDTNEMSVRQAEEITGWTLDDPRVDPTRPDSLRLMPHQIVDVAQLFRKISVFPHAALLASACGIGKTYINLGTIVQGFPNDLVPHIYYGTPSDHGSSLVKHAVVPKDKFSSVLQELREDDPDSAKHVFISSYSTFMRRSMRSTVKSRRDLTEHDRLVLGLCLGTSPTAHHDSSLSSEPGHGNSEFVGEADVLDVPQDVRLEDNEFQYPSPSDAKNSEDDGVHDNNSGDATPKHPTAADDDAALQEPSVHCVGAEPSSSTVKIFSPDYEKVFNVVVLDEAHLVKSRTSNLHRMIKVIRREHLIMCTATPMLNNPTDVLSYSLLAWPLAKPSPLPNDFSFNSFYGPGAAWLNYKPHDDPIDRYLPNSQELDSGLARSPPESRCGFLAGFVRRREPRGPRRPLVDPRGLTPEEYDAIVKSGSRPWIVNPAYFYWACREFNAKRSFDACRKVVREMLSALIVKRGMQTRLRLPDGTDVAPGDGLPGACFRVVNVGFKPEDQATYLDVHAEWHTELYYSRTTRTRVDTDVMTSNPDLSARQSASVESMKRVNPSAFRQLLLPAFNLHNRKLLEPRERTAALVKALGVHEGGSASETVFMGTEHARALSLCADDGGAQWLFEALKAGPEYLMPNNRFALVYWLAYHSPILSQLVVQVRRWICQPLQLGLPNRVVIMATMPWVQQDVALCLKIFGWNVSSIRADLDVFHRNMIIEDFNNPRSKVDILLTSMDLSAFGLDLHGSCNKGIVVQWPWSANHLLQMLGRLPRIGQKRHVEWIIYTMPGTLYDRMQAIVWSKYVRQLAVESRIHDTVRGVLADITSYTLLFNLFSMPHHRWLWDRGAFDLDVYGSIDPLQRPQRLSLFFRYLGQMALDSPQRHSDHCFADFDALCHRDRKDFVSGAVLWLKERKPLLTWPWLAEHCLLDRIRDQLREPWVSEYLDPVLLDCLLGDDTPATPCEQDESVPPPRNSPLSLDPSRASSVPHRQGVCHASGDLGGGGVSGEHGIRVGLGADAHGTPSSGAERMYLPRTKRLKL
ncbi:hypothetical protein GGR53DRAFT_281151 [Hypoxylon sp. FL1150]|nr:hypothetical protein GGR53DRAFT_281151 [Hypoxylon sp. FL1150]